MADTQKVTRKLRAILSADVKGYSTLMANDEVTTIKTIKQFRQIMSEIVEAHAGRVVDMPGDNIMAEFSSVVNAVQSSVAIQKELKIKNADLPYEKRLEFRIGINIGDVVQDGEHLYGDGVNIAARIEGLAEPGGVCISRGAYDHIRNKLNFGYEYLGEHSVKNIKQPVRVYKILMDPEDAGRLIGERSSAISVKWIYAALFAVSVTAMLIGYQLYQKSSAPDFEPASVEKMAFALPEEPSIAVLPFTNMSKDPEKEYFSDGITEQIITSLSNVPYLFVIARNSTFSYKNKPIKAQQVAEELGVQYILEGSVQQSGNLVRITAQLIDAVSGHHVWAENYDREMIDIFKLQDEITMKIVVELQVKFSSADLGRLSSIKTESLRAYEKYLKAHKHMYSRSLKDTLEARRLAQEAIDLDQDYGAAYLLLARTYLDEIYMHRVESRDELLGQARKQIEKSTQLIGVKPAHRTWSSYYLLKKQPEKAVDEAKKAIDVAPSSAAAYFNYGHVLWLTGRYNQAIPVLKKAIRLNPISPINYLNNLAFAYTGKKEYDKAIPLWQETLKRNSDYYYAHFGLTAVYQLIGEYQKATEFAERLLRIKPELSISMLEKRVVQKDKEFKTLILGALRDAGIPEYPRGKKIEKLSIAVLPFVNMSDDPKQEYFSDGISEDIITDLSKISRLTVISRSSSFTYKGKSVNTKQIGQELQVRYLLEGSIRKAGDQVRINAQLIDAVNDRHLWAERYDGRLDDVFALQDKITRKIISALALKLTAKEEKAVMDKGTENLQAYDAFLKGWQGYRLLTEAGFADAKRHLEKAVELDPEFSRAYAALAILYWKATQIASPELRKGLGLSTRKTRHAALALPHLLVKRAMKRPTALAHGLMSQLYLTRYQHDEALYEIEQAIAMDPNDPELYASMSHILYLMGKNKEAVESAKTGLRLDPNNPTAYLIQLAKIHLPDGDLEESLQLLDRAKRLNPDLSGSVAATKSILYGLQNRDEEARTQYKIYLKSRQNPVRNLNDVLLYYPFTDPKKLDRIAGALVKAGAPGKPNDYYRILKENRLGGQEAESLLFGRRVTGTSMSTGKRLVWEWTESGEFKITEPFQDIGKSWTEADVFFIQFKNFLGGLPYGTVIYRNPDGSKESRNEYFMVSDIGSITPFAPAE